MEEFLGHAFWVILAILIFQLFIAFLLVVRASQPTPNDGTPISAVSVIIPFHNEADRIKPLLNSISAQKELPKQIEFIFVNDGSTDHSVELIHYQNNPVFTVQNLHQKLGKKAAIQKGIEAAKYPFILTLDADVSLPNEYFEAFAFLPERDVIILPVNMNGSKFIQRMGSIEFNWLQLMTFGSSKPVLCNGANLVIRKSAFEKANTVRTDFNIASGDDVFLLKAASDLNLDVLRKTWQELTVSTPAPSSYAQLIAQRKRWIGKVKSMKTASGYFHALMLFLVQSSFLFCLVFCFANPILLYPILLKLVGETLVAAHYNRDRLETLPYYIFIHQFWYPIYLLSLIIPGKKESKWV